MLYEVITFTPRNTAQNKVVTNVPDKSTNIIGSIVNSGFAPFASAFIAIGVPWSIPSAIAEPVRITSYNVCYTKLLRFLINPQTDANAMVSAIKIPHDVYFSDPILLFPIRITSYNVCYTKLLRSGIQNLLRFIITDKIVSGS